jgi:hypothetical protein
MIQTTAISCVFCAFSRPTMILQRTRKDETALMRLPQKVAEIAKIQTTY